jgi:GDPmannose 4,6-dehydratase
VVGVVRDSSRTLDHLEGVDLVEVDLLDQAALAGVLRDHGPREVYNLASPSFVPRSWDHPVETAEFAAVGVTSLLEAVRAVDDGIRVYQASSSEIFGEPAEVPQSESTPLAPVTPYGVAKAYGHFIIGSYRRRYGLHASAGILYNHESPRRPESFLPSKVAHAVARIASGDTADLQLGDLDAQRDWGYACDSVEAMRLMLQQDEPGDYVIATGELHSVRELVEVAFSHVGLDWRDHVRVDESLKRGQAELHHLVGDASKAREQLGWKPSVTFEELVALLVDAAAAK